MKSYEYEFEKRAMLTHKQYIDIVSFLNRKYSPIRLFTLLLNEYFDTDDLYLINNGIVLRTRHTFKDGVVLTLKVPLVDKSGDLEISQQLNLSDYDLLKNSNSFPEGLVKNKLIELGVITSSIKYIDSLKCKRTEIKDGEYVIVLDENTYGDITDFDIEIEAPSLEEANKKILEFAEMFHFEVKDDYQSKSRRVLLAKS